MSSSHYSNLQVTVYELRNRVRSDTAYSGRVVHLLPLLVARESEKGPGSSRCYSQYQARTAVVKIA